MSAWEWTDIQFARELRRRSTSSAVGSPRTRETRDSVVDEDFCCLGARDRSQP